MHGICITCGGQTSTPTTQRCKNCYREELKKSYQISRNSRDKQILDLVLFQQKSAADAARKFNLSREAVRLILVRNGVDYAVIKRERKTKKDILRVESKNRPCKWCQKPFTPPHGDGRVKYCSDVCRDEQRKDSQRRRVKMYYLSEKGKVAYNKTLINRKINKAPEISI